MTEQETPQPKLTAMQKADRALERLDDLDTWRGQLPADSPGRLAEDVAALAQGQQDLVQKVGDLEAIIGDMADWRQGFLAADGPKGVVAIDDKVTELAKQVAELSEWRQAELDPDGLGREDALAERLAEVERELADLKTRPQATGLTFTARPSAPHVLGLIVQLKKQIGAIGKDRHTDHKGGRYDFRGVDDAINAIGNACDMVGIVPPRATVVNHTTNTDVIEGRVWTSSTVVMRYTFTSPVDGSEWYTEGVGEGRDLGDKSLTKAQAGAYKYAMFHGLSIAIEGMNVDSETDHPVIEGRPADQGSHEYRQWENAQENAEQREYERAAAAQEPPGDVQAAARAQQDSFFASKEDAAAYCKQRGDAVGTLAQLNQIMAWAEQQGLMNTVVDGSPLGVWLLVAAQTKPPVVTG